MLPMHTYKSLIKSYIKKTWCNYVHRTIWTWNLIKKNWFDGQYGSARCGFHFPSLHNAAHSSLNLRSGDTTYDMHYTASLIALHIFWMWRTLFLKNSTIIVFSVLTIYDHLHISCNASSSSSLSSWSSSSSSSFFFHQQYSPEKKLVVIFSS